MSGGGVGATPRPSMRGAPRMSKDLPVVGYVSISTGEPCLVASAFRTGLREHGYTDGTNIHVEWRFAAGQPERYPSLVGDLVRRPVDVLVVAESQAIPVAMAATDRIPIVVMTGGDPVGMGFADSLEQPNRNVTGMTNLAAALARQRLALLRTIEPASRRCAVVWNAAHAGVRRTWEVTRAAAAEVRTELQSCPVRSPNELLDTIEAAADNGADTLLVLQDHLTTYHRSEITKRVLAVGLPGMYG